MRLILLTFALIWGTAVSAYDVREIHRSGYWSVDLLIQDNGALDCRIINENPAHGIWSLVYGRSQPLAVLYMSVYDASVGRARHGQVDLYFDTHSGNRYYGQEWNLWGANYEQMDGGWLFIEFGFDPQNDFIDRFLNAIAAHLHLELVDSRGAQVGYWSLRGSRAAVNAFYDCLGRI